MSIKCAGCGFPLGSVNDPCPTCLPNFYAPIASGGYVPNELDRLRAELSRLQQENSQLKTEKLCAVQRYDSLSVQYSADKKQWQEAAQAERRRAEKAEQENSRLQDRLGTAEGTIELLKQSREKAEAENSRLEAAIREATQSDSEEAISEILEEVAFDYRTWNRACDEIKKAESWQPNHYPSWHDRVVFVALKDRAEKAEQENGRLQAQLSKAEAQRDLMTDMHRVAIIERDQLVAENSQLREYIAQLQQSLVSCAVQLEPNNEARKQAVQIWQNPPELWSERVQEEKR